MPKSTRSVVKDEKTVQPQYESNMDEQGRNVIFGAPPRYLEGKKVEYNTTYHNARTRLQNIILFLVLFMIFFLDNNRRNGASHILSRYDLRYKSCFYIFLTKRKKAY